MIRIVMLVTMFSVVAALVGTISLSPVGSGVSSALAQHDGPPPDDPPPDVPEYQETPPEKPDGEPPQPSHTESGPGQVVQTIQGEGQVIQTLQGEGEVHGTAQGESPSQGKFQDVGSLHLGGDGDGDGEVDLSRFGNFEQFSDGSRDAQPAFAAGTGEAPEFDFKGFFREVHDASAAQGPAGQPADVGDLGGVFGSFEQFDGEFQDLTDFEGDFNQLGEFFERSDAAKDAFNAAKDLSLRDLDNLSSDLAHDLIGDLDFFALHDLDSTVVEDLLHSAEQAGDVLLDGRQAQGILGTLDQEAIKGLSEKLKDLAYDAIDGQGFLLIPPENAAAFFESSLLGEDSDFTAKLAELGDDAHNLLAAADHEFYAEIGDKMEEIFDSIDFENLDLGQSALDGPDIGAILAELGDSLPGKGRNEILAALDHTAARDLVAIEGHVASDLIASVGLGEVSTLAQFDGLVATLGVREIQGLGQDITEVLDSLDFRANSDILDGFSFDALHVITSGDIEGTNLGNLDLSELGNLANAAAGQIFNLDSGQLQDIIASGHGNDYANWDPIAVSGAFAGLEPDEIVDIDPQTLHAALLAADADFGLQDFNLGVSGGDTAFDLLAAAVDQGNALTQDGSQALHQNAVSLLQQNLFAN